MLCWLRTTQGSTWQHEAYLRPRSSQVAAHRPVSNLVDSWDTVKMFKFQWDPWVCNIFSVSAGWQIHFWLCCRVRPALQNQSKYICRAARIEKKLQIRGYHCMRWNKWYGNSQQNWDNAPLPAAELSLMPHKQGSQNSVITVKIRISPESRIFMCWNLGLYFSEYFLEGFKGFWTDLCFKCFYSSNIILQLVLKFTKWSYTAWLNF